MSIYIRLYSSVSIASLLLIGSPALAQESGAASQATASSSVTPDGAGDIIVTANKREQNLSKVGQTISALTSEQLANQQISTVADLALATPGLTFAPTPRATPVYTIRGVGFYESTLAAYPDVSLYIDQAPLPLPIMSSLTAFDLERVEVLKGPQGTLFGNNATGGAINFVAAKPTNDFAAGASLSYGRFNTFEAAGYISGAITSTLKARLALRAVNGDEWQRSYTRDDRLGKQDNIAGRLIVDWDPTDNFKISVNLNAWRDQNDPQAPQKIASVPQNSVPADFPLAIYPNAPLNARAADWAPEPRTRPTQDNRFKQATVRADYNMGGATLTSITGYSHMKTFNKTESSGTSLLDTDIGSDRATLKSFTQELRLASDSAQRLRWVIGGNFERTTVDQETADFYADSTSAAANGIVISYFTSSHTMKNYAGFANAEFDITDQLTLKGGIRYTEANRDFATSLGDSPLFPITSRDRNPVTGAPGLTLTDFFNAVYGAIYGGAVPTIAPGASIILDTRLNADGTPVDPATYLTTAPLFDSLKEDNVSWSAGIDFKPSDSLLLYGNVSKGYKAGSFPHLAGAIYGAFESVKQESLLSFEVGVKSSFLDRKISLNVAAFWYDYQNKQLRAKFVDPIFGALDTLVNVPKSRIKGAELELVLRPIEGLSLSASGTYLDAKVVRYDGVVGTTTNELGLREPILASFKGVRLPFSPKLQYAIRADYDFPLGSELSGFVGAGINGQTKSIGVLTTFGIDPALFEINGRALVNLNAGIGSADERWKLSVWGKNVFNKYYWNNALQGYDTVVRYTGRPAEYGVTLAVKM